jgi:hypothetical protein
MGAGVFPMKTRRTTRPMTEQSSIGMGAAVAVTLGKVVDAENDKLLRSL